MNNKHKILLDFLAIIVALMATIFTCWQIVETRNHNVLSLRPHLDLSLRGSNDLNFRSLRLDNAGLGPAFIENVRFSQNGKTIPRDKKNNKDDEVRPYLQIVLDTINWPTDDFSRNRILRTTLPKGASIAAGGIIHIFKIESELTPKEYQKLRSLEVEITYKSIHNQTCKVTFDPKKENSYAHVPCK